ncbi:MAG: hypothetical protein R3B13_26855 [Polyangiaceae bacterium]
MRVRRAYLAFACMCSCNGLATRARAQTSDATAPTAFHTSDSAQRLERLSLVEFSVGTYQSFDSTKVFRYSDDVELLPTSVAAFMVEYFVTQYWRATFVYDLPLTSEQRVVAGKFEERSLPSVMSGGIEWAPFQFVLRGNTRLELEGMALGGVELGGDARFVPGLMGRVHLSAYAADTTGFGVYLGVHHMFVVNRVGPLYGVGYRF